jgi:hypothetical protein
VRAAVLFTAAFLLAGCSPSELQQAVKVADDVSQIARVLCLSHHARAEHAQASLVTEACQTVEQLAPFIDEAQGQLPKARCQ